MILIIYSLSMPIPLWRLYYRWQCKLESMQIASRICKSIGLGFDMEGCLREEWSSHIFVTCILVFTPVLNTIMTLVCIYQGILNIVKEL